MNYRYLLAFIFIFFLVSASVGYAQVQIVREEGPTYNSQYQNTSSNNPSLTNPNQAKAGSLADKLGTIYNIACTVENLTGGDCAVDASNWTFGEAAVNMGCDIAGTGLICGNKCDAVIVQGEPCWDPANTTYTNRMLESGRIPGGAAAQIGYTYAYVTNEAPQPTNLALFFRETTGDTIFGSPAYAATNIDDSLLDSIVFDAWAITRNLALALMGLVIGLSAIMVMFRKKLPPQATVTVWNVLPKIPLGIFLIIMSYPIIALMISLITPLIGFVLMITREFMGEVITSAFQTDDLIMYTVAFAINQIFGFAVGLSGISMFMMVFIILAAILTIVMLIIALINVLKAYVSLIISIILSPFIIVVGLLPGKGDMTINLAKRVVVDTLTIPFLLFMVMLGLAIIAYPINVLTASTAFYLPYVWFGASFFLFVIKAGIGLLIIWRARKVRSMLEGALGVHGLFGGGDDKQRR